LRRRLFFGSMTIDDVAAPDRLGDQVGERHALAGLGGAHQQRAALEVLQRPVQRAFLRFDAVDEGQADLGVGLGLAVVAQQLQQARRYGELPVVDLGEFVEPLRMHGLPFEAEAQEH
jgi:hypothetical protein